MGEARRKFTKQYKADAVADHMRTGRLIQTQT